MYFNLVCEFTIRRKFSVLRRLEWTTSEAPGCRASRISSASYADHCLDVRKRAAVTERSGINILNPVCF
jgi:hypothetical protein